MGRDLRRTKILSNQEMARIEQLAISEKGQAEAESYMDQVGSGVAKVIYDFFQKRLLSQGSASVVLLCGKGNNGGDAYVVGQILLEKGFKVSAIQLGDLKDCSQLCQKKAQGFKESKGAILTEESCEVLFKSCDLILDGLLGTGFKGFVTKPYGDLIGKANTSDKIIFSLDIPSGLSPEALAKDSKSIIKAEKTFYLCLPKKQFFFLDAINYCGDLVYIDFSLDSKYEDLAQSEFLFLGQKSFLRSLLPKFKRTVHKYERGSSFIWAGSENMIGASILASKACYRSGCGLVTLLTAHKEVILKLPELLISTLELPSDQEKEAKLLEKINGNKACLMGPGLGQEKSSQELLQKLVPFLSIPLVLDADALTFYSQAEFKLPSTVVMTPHLGELTRLLHLEEKPEINEALLKKVRNYCEERGITLVVKGAPTFVISPNEKASIYAGGSIGLAKGGSGDVLAGMITALLSQGLSAYKASCLAVFLHGEAGKLASEKRSSYSVLPSDVIEAISEAYKNLLIE